MKKGLIECPKCKGKKYLDYKKNSQFKSKLMCHQCDATGTVDWIDVIFNRMKLTSDHWVIYERVNKSDSIVCQELVL